MTLLRLAAPAKINWRLAITGRRGDGYHLLMGLMQSVSLCDMLTLRLSDRDSCHTVPPLPGAPQDNLALRAWLLLKQELGLRQGLEIRVEKRIPVGSGLGGGSADAAAVLKGANSLLALGLDPKELAGLALKLGADVPFCIYGGLAQACGVGEHLTTLPAPPPLHLLLVNPGFPVPTAQVFQHYKTSGQRFSDSAYEEQACTMLATALAGGDIAVINGLLANDLASSAKYLYPRIGELEQSMRTAGLTPLLSGSGGTMFALLPDAAALQRARQVLSEWPWSASVVTLGAQDDNELSTLV